MKPLRVLHAKARVCKAQWSKNSGNPSQPERRFDVTGQHRVALRPFWPSLLTLIVSSPRPSSSKTGRHERSFAQALRVALALRCQGEDAAGHDLAGKSSVASVMQLISCSIVCSTNNRNHLGIEAIVGGDKLRDLRHPRAPAAPRAGDLSSLGGLVS
jgi:hypothetical protein